MLRRLPSTLWPVLSSAEAVFQPTACQVGAWQADEAVRVARLSRDSHLFHAAASSPTSSAIARSAALSSGIVVRGGVLRGFITTPLLNKDEHKNVATPAWPPAPVHWIERAVPAKLLPYVHLARLHKPIGSWLLAWPGFLSIGLAASPGALPDVTMLALFGVGAVCLRGAGCSINDLTDRDLDKQVARTRYRPLAAGVLNARQAVAFIGVQLAFGSLVWLQLNTYSKLLALSSLALVVAYPRMKRITSWVRSVAVAPQAFLGLTINWGALLGWAAVRGSVDWTVAGPLYLSGVCWTLLYDTIYGHMDKRDDVKAGIKSTALLFGQRSKPALYGLAATMCVLQTCSGVALGAGPLYFAGVTGSAAHAVWQVRSVDLDVPADCLAKFKSNAWLPAPLMAGIVSDRWVAGGLPLG